GHHGQGALQCRWARAGGGGRHRLELQPEKLPRRVQPLAVAVPMWMPTPRNLSMRRAVRRLDAIIYGYIRRRRQSGEDKGDLLSILLHARDEADGKGMTDRQVRDEAMTLFLAGHETTALALSWT